uniref:Ovule protein n=1 Tax=Caenorhabditis tropicalis TaxID=1561998 RepID=A0A1I7U7W2_9PELO
MHFTYYIKRRDVLLSQYYSKHENVVGGAERNKKEEASFFTFWCLLHSKHLVSRGFGSRRIDIERKRQQ